MEHPVSVIGWWWCVCVVLLSSVVGPFFPPPFSSLSFVHSSRKAGRRLAAGVVLGGIVFLEGSVSSKIPPQGSILPLVPLLFFLLCRPSGAVSKWLLVVY